MLKPQIIKPTGLECPNGCKTAEVREYIADYVYSPAGWVPVKGSEVVCVECAVIEECSTDDCRFHLCDPFEAEDGVLRAYEFKELTASPRCGCQSDLTANTCIEDVIKTSKTARLQWPDC